MDQDTTLHDIELRELRDKWKDLLSETLELVKALQVISHHVGGSHPHPVEQRIAHDALVRWCGYLEGKK